MRDGTSLPSGSHGSSENNLRFASEVANEPPRRVKTPTGKQHNAGLMQR